MVSWGQVKNQGVWDERGLGVEERRKALSLLSQIVLFANFSIEALLRALGHKSLGNNLIHIGVTYNTDLQLS